MPDRLGHKRNRLGSEQKGATMPHRMTIRTRGTEEVTCSQSKIGFELIHSCVKVGKVLLAQSKTLRCKLANKMQTLSRQQDLQQDLPAKDLQKRAETRDRACKRAVLERQENVKTRQRIHPRHGNMSKR